MVSEFQCPCHGTMRGSIDGQDVTSRVLFYPGSNNEGYWTSQHMQEQLQVVIPLFESLHPGMVAVFLFDQSSNHKAFAPDALVAKKMNMNAIEVNSDGSSPQGNFRDPTFYVQKNYDFAALQKAYYSAKTDIQKRELFSKILGKPHPRGQLKTYFIGIKGILKNRGLLKDEKMKRYCEDVALVDGSCCAVHLLERQPDFASQKSLLAEAVESSGHIFELYPKYHCECNWIERYWGAAKKEARNKCDYTFKSLDKNINTFLDSVCPPGQQPLTIRRYFLKSFSYIDAYNKGMAAKEAFELVKQFSKLHKSHRKLRANQ